MRACSPADLGQPIRAGQQSLGRSGFTSPSLFPSSRQRNRTCNEDPGAVAKLEEKVAVLMAQQQKVLELLANQNQLDTNGIQQVRQRIPKYNNQTHTQEQQPATSEVQESQAGTRETMASSFGANLSHFPQKVKPDRSKSSTENMRENYHRAIY